jgi:hypothetical protein
MNDALIAELARIDADQRRELVRAVRAQRFDLIEKALRLARTELLASLRPYRRSPYAADCRHGLARRAKCWVASMTEQFVKLPRDLLESAAWRSMSINARRLIDYLLIEFMRHAGKQNGFLLAPRDQLEGFGIGRHFISAAVQEVEQLGLVDCCRGTGRRPNTYGLTWLPATDKSAPTNRWRLAPVAGAKQHPQEPKTRGAKQHHPSRISYQGGDVSQKVGDRVVSLTRAVGSGKGPSAGKPKGRVAPW